MSAEGGLDFSMMPTSRVGGLHAPNRFRPLALDALTMLFITSGFLTATFGIIDYIFRVLNQVDVLATTASVLSIIGFTFIVVALYKGAGWSPVFAVSLMACISLFNGIFFYALTAYRLPFFISVSMLHWLTALALQRGWAGSRSIAICAAAIGTMTLFLSIFQLWLIFRKEVLYYFSNPVDSRLLLSESRSLRDMARKPFSRAEWQEAYRLFTESDSRYAQALSIAAELGDSYVLGAGPVERATVQNSAIDSQTRYWAVQDEATRKRIAEEEEIFRKKAEEDREREEDRRILDLMERARKFEKACRFTEAIKAYHEAGLMDDAARVRTDATVAAQKMGSARRWEEAAVLYESLEMWDEAGRTRRDAHGAPIVAASTECSAVEVLRDYDHYQGFIRVKVALRNSGRALIADARLRMDFDADSLRLDHAEPQMLVTGTEVVVGNVLPGQRKAIAMFFDPQVCGASPLDGMVTFRDSAGSLCSVPFKHLLIEVRCPLLFTPEQANTALVRNLMQETLMNRDVKMYALPMDLDRSRAFSIAKESIHSLDVRLVSEHTRGGQTEAWFYGQVKNTDERIVLRTALLPDSVELFVAADSRTAITGLLAELGRAFTKRMREVGFRTVQITNIEIRDSVINRSTLFLDGAEGSVTLTDSVVNRVVLGGIGDDQQEPPGGWRD